MARLHHGLLGATTGKVGNVVAERWKSINYIREIGESSKPRTEAQILHAENYATANECYKILIKSRIRDVILLQTNNRLTPQQAFIKLMLKGGLDFKTNTLTKQIYYPFKAKLAYPKVTITPQQNFGGKISNPTAFKTTDFVNYVKISTNLVGTTYALLKAPLLTVSGLLTPPTNTANFVYCWVCRTDTNTPSGKVIATSPVLQIIQAEMYPATVAKTLKEAILRGFFNA